MRQRDDLLTDNSLGGIEVIQLTAEEVPSSHVYMENANGRFIRLTGGNGADVHVIADDGTNLRDLPWGRDGNEFCQGHQGWIGADERALTSISMREPACAELIEARGVPHVGHDTLRTPGGVRNNLSRQHPQADFYHFATDAAGHRLITDAGPNQGGGTLWLGTIPEAETSAIDDWTCLLCPGSSGQKGSHNPPLPVA